MKLSSKEEQIMSLIWQNGRVYMKDLMEALPDPKPAPTTVATLLKRLNEKGAIDYELHGNSRQYYSLIDKKDYSSSYLKNMISTFFQGSSGRFASFFAQNANLSKQELEELRSIIDNKLKDSES
ncbi:BlaI/MecI/CopY family transcriptional regulator [Fulvivirga ligni]|uniref:BlaI/MecI/CopY family transcriptional regulator n=1 Tax=Fulvivirga ligni TaxID=2904246 RepID=UPI001F1CAE87|nr:BlaI/MecI/CopY family transcriptional regulator [Fulvivirga ligni]UII20660.1 BlaI/MecI/CopY family transcriptional regulator [Fulvivirga ligni]